MVTPSGSRPAALSQREVDDFAAGRASDASLSLLRAERFEPKRLAAKRTASSPAPLQPGEAQEVAARGAAPENVLKRIVAAPGAVPQKKSRAEPRGSAPERKPPKPPKAS